MTKMEWFIFKGTHHTGPFSFEEMEKMLLADEINVATLVWHEGMAKWELLKNVAAFSPLIVCEEIQDLPPALPVDLPPDLPPPLPFKSKPILKEPEFFRLEEDVTAPKIKIKGVRTNDINKWGLIAFSFIVAILVAWQFSQLSSNRLSFIMKDLMPSHLEKLEMISGKNFDNTEVGFALTMNGRKIYMATNNGRELQLLIRLVPIKNKILGTENSNVMLRGRALSHLAVFEKVSSSEGKLMTPGMYQYSMVVSEKHPLHSYFPIFMKLGLLKNLNRKYKLEGKDLLYPGPDNEFFEKLKKYNEEMKDKLSRPLQDRLEKIKTLASFADMINDEFVKLLSRSKTGKEMKAFENYYIANIAPIVQAMAVNEPPSIKNENAPIATLTGLCARIIERNGQIKKIDKKESLYQAKLVTNTLLVLKSELEQHQKAIEEDLKAFTRSN